ncbi:MAG: hypothetical protein CUN55_03970 [Phototrophicales bacterium]|nr:MAG: hypothetical protein CUN55_03970 [Phototrophicales bacterium]
MKDTQNKQYIDNYQYMRYAETMDTTDLVLFAKAIADETRQEIMRLLCCNWLNVTELVERLEGRVKQPTISHHLRLLEEAGLVHSRRDGRQHYYTLNQDRMTVCCGQLMLNFAPNHQLSIDQTD